MSVEKEKEKETLLSFLPVKCRRVSFYVIVSEKADGSLSYPFAGVCVCDRDLFFFSF